MVRLLRFIINPVMLLTLIGLLITVGLSYFGYRINLNNNYAALEKEITLTVEAFTTKVSNLEHHLLTLSDFYDASKSVDAREFQYISARIINENPFIKGIYYFKRVKYGEEENFRAEAAKQGFTPLPITGIKGQDNYVYYYRAPVTADSPKRVGEVVSRSAEFKHMVDYFKAAAIPVADFQPWLSDATAQPHLWLMHGVYHSNSTRTTYRERVANLKGFVALEVDPTALIDHIGLPEETRLQLLLQTTEGSEKKLIATVGHLSHEEAPHNSLFERYYVKQQKLHRINTILTAVISAVVLPQNIDLFLAYAGLAVGLFITLCLFLLGRNMMSRYQQSHQLAELHRSEANINQRAMNAIMNGTYDGIMTLKAVRDGKGKITDFIITSANKNAYHFTNRTGKELEGKSFIKEFPSTIKQGLFTKHCHVVEQGTPFTEIVEYNEDGVHGWFDITSLKLDDGVVLSFADITKRMEYEKNLETTVEKARQASQAKSSFLANMSHEIRTPMNGIIGTAELLGESSLDAEQQQLLHILKQSSQSLLYLINDILDLSKIEAGQVTLEYIPFNLIATIEELGELFSSQAHAKKLDLVLDYPADLPRQLLGDPLRIRQILSNFISNAIKFTAKGTVCLSVTVVKSDDEGMVLRLAVSDTGIGIAKEQLTKVFDKFTQADESTTRNFGGTGLGLSLCRELAELMQGKVGVTSQVGKGSTFYTELSFKVDNTVCWLPTPRKQISNSGHILLLDDNEFNLRVLSKWLDYWGASYDVAQSAQAALNILAKAPKTYTLVISASQMPDMDGETFGSAVRNNREFDHIKLIVLTSAARTGDGNRFAKAGFIGYLTKPVQSDLLLKSIESACGVNYTTVKKGHELITAHSIKESEMLNSGIQKGEKVITKDKARILLVEDNESNRMIAVHFITKLGCIVDTAENGQVAIEKVKAGAYDLVFMDCQMPIMDGFEATKAIREWEHSEGNEALPIIALTANAMKEDKEACLKVDMNSYLSKPVRKDQLAAALKEFLPHIKFDK